VIDRILTIPKAPAETMERWQALQDQKRAHEIAAK